MNYSIVKYESNKKSVVGTLSRTDDMLNYVIFFESYEDVDVLNNCLAEELQSSVYQDGEYLLTYGNIIQYVIRKTLLSEGLIHDKIIVRIERLVQYEAVKNIGPHIENITVADIVEKKSSINIMSKNVDKMQTVVDSILDQYDKDVIKSSIVFTDKTDYYKDRYVGISAVQYESDALNIYIDTTNQFGLIIFDNSSIDYHELEKDMVFREIFFTSNQLNKKIVIQNNELFCFEPIIRCSFGFNLLDYNYGCNQKKGEKGELKTLYKTYFGMVPDFKIFQLLLSQDWLISRLCLTKSVAKSQLAHLH